MESRNLSVAANRVLRLLQSEDVVGAIGATEEELVQRMVDAISTVSPLLQEAKDKEDHTKYWLRDFEETLEAAENLLESVMYEAALRLRQRISGRKYRAKMVIRRVCGDILCSKSLATTPPVGFHLELKLLTERVEKAVSKRGVFDLSNETVEKGIRVPDELVKELVSADSYFGQGVCFLPREDGDKTAVFSFLFNASSKDVEALLVVGGYGRERRTALARSVFEDERVQAHFQLRIWAGLGSYDWNFSEKVEELIVMSAAESGGTEEVNRPSSENFVKLLAESLRGKRYLIVVDNISHKSDDLYYSLLLGRSGGARGSRVLMITSDRGFASRTNAFRSPHYFESASIEETRDLFEKMAFGGREAKEWHEHIVRSCRVLSIVPMMAMAGTLYFEEESEAEMWVLSEEFSNVMCYAGKYRYHSAMVDPFLTLCYDRLPSNLKLCFAYCSLFPRGHELDVQMVIRLWMAQGFIMMSDADDVEEVGYGYFLNLIRRFFFYEAKVDARGRVTKCKMHGLMHDLSTFEARYCCQLYTQLPIPGDTSTISHFSFCSEVVPLQVFLLNLCNRRSASKVRSVLLPTQFCNDRRKMHGLVARDWDLLVSNCTSLRALDMHGSAINMVPDSIGKLKHLKYLDLSNNPNLTELPSSITNILNLQTLRLSSCFRLTELPRNIGNLVNLRHLEIDGCHSLASLPRGFGRLTNLRTLLQVVVSNNTSEANNEVSELKRLHNLREFRIKNLRHGMHEFLDGIQKLRSLSLEWEYRAPRPEDKKITLKNQFKDLEELSLNGCTDLNYTFSLRSFPNNLRKLSLKRCMNCRVLPPLDLCVSLRLLVLDEMADLEYVSENFSEKVCLSLQEVWLTELPRLKGWSKKTPVELPSFARLCKLVIEDCPEFDSIPLFPTLSEGLVLDSTSWEPFELTMKLEATPNHPDKASSSSCSSSAPLSKLKSLCIVAIENFDNSKAEEIAWETLESLRLLKLDFLPKLDRLPEGVRRVKTLRELHIWRCGVKELPVWITELKFLEKLVIRVCPSLETLPEEFKSFRSLKTLEIEDCLTLVRRCEKGIGADWDKIAHIPDRRLGRIST